MKRTLVVVVKSRHHAKDLILVKILHGFSHVSSHVLERVHASVPGCSNIESIYYYRGKILGNLMAISAGFWTDIYPLDGDILLSHNEALYFTRYGYAVTWLL